MVQPATNRLLVESQLGVANGIAKLDAGGRLPEAQLPIRLKDGRVVCAGYTRADVIAALNAAEAIGRHTIVYFPRGVYDVVQGLSLSGYSAQIRGDGAGGTKNQPTGTVFWASAQTGPVLDFTGWIVPSDVMTGRIKHSDFMVRGSGVGDPTKNNAGMRLKIMSSATFADIAIRETGGPCLEFVSNPGNAVYLNDFERFTFAPPVDAKLNDVPWILADEPNGNRFRSFGFRSLLTAGDVGVSGAVVIKSNASFPSYGNLFEGWWFENLHVPSGGTLVSMQGIRSQISDFGLHDIKKEVGATGTSWLRLIAPTSPASFGGNRVTGFFPGNEGGTTIDNGIEVHQSRNAIEGVKGYNGTNVTLMPGVQYTNIRLAGSYSTVTNPAVVDNSGNLTNSYRDEHNSLEVLMNRVGRDTTFSSTGNLRIYDTQLANNGGLALGKSGARIQALGGSGGLYYVPGPGQAHIFQDGAAAEIFRTTSAGVKIMDGKSIRLGAATTAARQTPATAGAGAMIFDSTLGFPIYSDGTNWRKLSDDSIV